ncbi:hypothetical protein EN916_20745, partial [Mesorhizobium sp. M7A.F.Ca.CA.001.11.2.1]
MAATESPGGHLFFPSHSRVRCPKKLMETAMTMKVLENGAESFVTAGGITITRARHDRPYAGAI